MADNYPAGTDTGDPAGQTAEKKQRTKRKNLTGLVTAPTPQASLEVKKPGPAPGSGTAGPSRLNQQAGVQAAAKSRKLERDRTGARDLLGDLAAADEAEDLDDMEMDPSAWARRCESQHAAWTKQCSCHRDQYLEYLPENLQRYKAQKDAKHQQLQDEIDKWRPSACECTLDASFTCSVGEVDYFGLDCTFTLKGNEFRCQCSRISSPPPLAFGCFPATPTAPRMWFDLRALHLYRRQALEGMSTTGENLFNKCLHVLDQLCIVLIFFFSCHIGYLGSLSEGHEYWCGNIKSIRASSFQAVYSSGYLPMVADVGTLQNLGVQVSDENSVFSNCPMCSKAPEGMCYDVLHN